MIIEKLSRFYREAQTELNYGSPFQLLVAVMLSAQTTDKQVNRITAGLFQKYREPEDFAALSEKELAGEIKGCGLYRTKARNIIHTSHKILAEYGGQVPGSLEELLTLPGVGRKTANVVLSVAFGLPALAVDTHVFRVAARLGLARGKTPEETEEGLKKIIPEKDWKDAHHWLIHHGRRYCAARNPRCFQCFLLPECPQGQKLLPEGPADRQKEAGEDEEAPNIMEEGGGLLQ